MKLAHHRPFQAIGFHSCDIEVGLRLLNGTDQLKHSTNSWDWLGWGAYFWEQNPQKALEYARKCAIGKQVYSGDIKTPFIIGAIIELNNCLNLVEPSSINIVKEAHRELEETMKESGEIMPENKGANRALDCAVIQSIHESNKREYALNPNGDIKPYDTVRSPFHEGGAIYKGSAFTEGLHIEISVINIDVIRGFFLPRPIDVYNPYLHSPFNKDEYLKNMSK